MSDVFELLSEEELRKLRERQEQLRGGAPKPSGEPAAEPAPEVTTTGAGVDTYQKVSAAELEAPAPGAPGERAGYEHVKILPTLDSGREGYDHVKLKTTDEQASEISKALGGALGGDMKSKDVVSSYILAMENNQNPGEVLAAIEAYKKSYGDGSSAKLFNAALLRFVSAWKQQYATFGTLAYAYGLNRTPEMWQQIDELYKDETPDAVLRENIPVVMWNSLLVRAATNQLGTDYMEGLLQEYKSANGDGAEFHSIDEIVSFLESKLMGKAGTGTTPTTQGNVLDQYVYKPPSNESWLDRQFGPWIESLQKKALKMIPPTALEERTWSLIPAWGPEPDPETKQREADLWAYQTLSGKVMQGILEERALTIFKEDYQLSMTKQGFMRDLLLGFAQTSPQLIGGFIADAIGRWPAYLAAGGSGNPEVAFIAGEIAGQTSGRIWMSSVETANNFYQMMKTPYTDPSTGKQTSIDPNLAAMISTFFGIINGQLEYVGWENVFAPFKEFLSSGVGKTAMQEVTKKAMKEGADGLVRYLMTAKAAALAKLKQGGTQFGTEILEELLQGISSWAGQNLAQSITNQTKGTKYQTWDMADLAKNIVDTGTQAAKGFFIAQLMSTAIGAGAAGVRAAQSQRAIDQKYGTPSVAPGIEAGAAAEAAAEPGVAEKAPGTPRAVAQEAPKAEKVAEAKPTPKPAIETPGARQAMVQQLQNEGVSRADATALADGQTTASDIVAKEGEPRVQIERSPDGGGRVTIEGPGGEQLIRPILFNKGTSDQQAKELAMQAAQDRIEEIEEEARRQDRLAKIPEEGPAAIDKGILALRLTDGRIVRSETARDFVQVADEHNVQFNEVAESGRWINGQYLDEGTFLDWYNKGAKREEMPAPMIQQFRDQMRKAMPQLADRQSNAAAAIVKTRARAMNLSVEEYLHMTFQPEMITRLAPPDGSLLRLAPDEIDKLNERAKEFFGVAEGWEPQTPGEKMFAERTPEWKDRAGWILTDGTIIMKPGYGSKSHGLGFSGTPIAALGGIPASKDWFSFTSGASAIRLNNEFKAAQIIGAKPTAAQLEALARFFEGAEELRLEMTQDNGELLAFDDIQSPDLAKMERFFGKPRKGTQFKGEAGEVARRRSWGKKMIKMFGITRDPMEAGFILPDGTMLDFSGRHYAGDYERSPDGTNVPKKGERDYFAHQRSVDHGELVDEADTLGVEGKFNTRAELLYWVMKNSGAVRMDAKAMAFETVDVPSDNQVRALARACVMSMSEGNGNSAYIDSLGKDGHVWSSAEVYRPNYDKLRAYFENRQPGITTYRSYGGWHGSGRGFTKFRSDMFATGSGGGSFGWGTYIASLMGVSKHYADALAEEPRDIYVLNLEGMQGVDGLRDKKMAIDKISMDLATGTVIERVMNGELEPAKALKFFEEKLDFQRNYLPSVKARMDQAERDFERSASEINQNKYLDRHSEFIYQARRLVEYNFLVAVLKEDQGRIRIEKEKTHHLYHVTVHGGKEPGQYDYMDWYEHVTPEQVKKINAQLEKEGFEWRIPDAKVELERYSKMIKDAAVKAWKGWRELGELATEQPAMQSLARTMPGDPPSGDWSDNDFRNWVSRVTTVSQQADDLCRQIREAYKAAQDEPQRAKWAGYTVKYGGVDWTLQNVFVRLLEAEEAFDKQTGEGIYTRLMNEYAMKMYGQQLAPSKGAARDDKRMASLLLLAAGIDGIRYPAGSMTYGNRSYENGTNYVVFDADQIKIDRHFLYQNEPNWLLRSSKIIKQKMRQTMPGSQVLQMLKGNGVKNDELKWIGLDEYLSTSEKRTPQEVMQWIADHNVQLQRKQLSDQYEEYTLPGGENYRTMTLAWNNVPAWWVDVKETLWNKHTGRVTTRHETYWYDHEPSRAQLDGLEGEIPGVAKLEVYNTGMTWQPGEELGHGHYGAGNILMHVRMKDRTINGKKTLFMEELQSDPVNKSQRPGTRMIEKMPEVYVVIPKGYMEAARKAEESGLVNGTDNALVTTWNAFGMNRVMAEDDGSRRMKAPIDANVTVIDERLNNEMQDKIAQVGKDMGLGDVHPYLANKAGRRLTNEEFWSAADTMAELRSGAAMFDFPFRENWYEIGLKMMLWEAAKGGYDQIAWTTGQQQIDRYPGLAEITSHVVYDQDASILYVYPQGAADPGDWKHHDVGGDANLGRWIGEENARKLLSQRKMASVDTARGLRFQDPEMAASHLFELKEQDMEIGGEGKKAFYDRIIPGWMQKQAKKWGTVVEKIDAQLWAPQSITRGLADQVEGLQEDLGNLAWEDLHISRQKIVRFFDQIRDREYMEEIKRVAGLETASALDREMADISRQLEDANPELYNRWLDTQTMRWGFSNEHDRAVAAISNDSFVKDEYYSGNQDIRERVPAALTELMKPGEKPISRAVDVLGINDVDTSTRDAMQRFHDYVQASKDIAGVITKQVWALPLSQEMKESGEEGQYLWKTAKGAVSFDEQGRALIHACEASDFSTVVHELAHIWRRQMNVQDIVKLERYLGVPDHDWGRTNEKTGLSFEEDFAQLAEQFVRDNVIPAPELRGMFDEFHSWLRDIYEDFGQYNMNDEVKRTFEGLFMPPKERAVRRLLEPFTESELAGMEENLKRWGKGNLSGVGLNLAEIRSIRSFGAPEGNLAWLEKQMGTAWEEEIAPGVMASPGTIAGPAGTPKALAFIQNQMRKNPVRWRGIIHKLESQAGSAGIGAGMTQEDMAEYEFEEAVHEAAARMKGDVQQVVDELMGYTEEEIKKGQTGKRWAYDEKSTAEKPEVDENGLVKVGPRFFRFSKATKIRLLKDALTSARREARLLLKGVVAEERAKYKERIAAFRTRESVNKIIEKIRAFPESKQYKELLPEHKKLIDDVLQHFDLRGIRKGYREALQEIRDWMKTPEVKGLVDIDEETLEEVSRLDQKNLRDMTEQDLQQLWDTLQEYVSLAEEVRWMIREGEKQEFLAARQEAVGEMPEAKEKTATEITSHGKRLAEMGQKARDLGDTLLGIGQEHWDFTVERMGKLGGILYRFVVKPIADGRSKANQYEQQMGDYLKQRVEEVGIPIKKLAHLLDEEVKTGKLTLTRGERVALFLHSQNEDNWACFTEAGFGFKFKHGERDTVYKAGVDYKPADLQAVMDSLTPEEKAVAEIAREMDEQMGEDVNVVWSRIKGRPFPLLENHWYKDTMPIGRGLTEEEKGIKEMAEAMVARPGVPKGWTKERKGVTLPLYLNSVSYDLWQAVERVSAYVGFEEPMRQATRLWQDQAFKDEVIKHFGRKAWSETWKGLKDVAGEQFSYDELERTLMRLRRGFMTAYIGFNPFTPLKQPLQWANGFAFVDPGSMWRGLMRTMKNPNAARRLNMLMSPKFRDRVEMGFTRDIAEFNRIKGSKAFMKATTGWRQLATWMVRYMDSTTVSAVMQGAVDQVMTQLKQGTLDPYIQEQLGIEAPDVEKMSPGDKLKLAYTWADWVVARTQDMSQPEHRSPLSRGGLFARMVTMFGSSTNQNWNLLRRTAREALVTKDPKRIRRAAFAFASVLILQPLAEAGINIARDRIRKKKDQGLLAEIIESIAGNLYFLRDIVQGVVSGINGEYLDMDIPPTRVINMLGQTFTSGAKWLFGETFLQRRRAGVKFCSQVIDLMAVWFEVPIYWTKHQIESLLKEEKVWPYQY